jgi:Ca2+-binding RTX toxin-like protein
MTRTEALTHGISNASLNPNTEIVITRQAGNVASTVFSNLVVLAELDNIEEIQVNTLAVTANNNNGGLDGNSGQGDWVQILGNFGTSTNATTSLNFSTITINGGADDTVDITGLSSDHRIVFNGAASTGQVIGDLRPQDVVNLVSPQQPGIPGGTTPPPQDGTTDPVGNGGSDGEDEGDTQQQSGNHAHDGQHDGGGHHDDHDSGCDTVPSTDTSTDTTSQAPVAQNGTAGDDVLIGGSGDDVYSGLDGDDLMLGNDGADTIKAGAGDDLVKAGAGDDVVFGNDGNDDLFGGSGKDLMTGDAGDDRLFGDAGDDALEGGTGNDTVYGGAGNDRIITTVGDGDDTYFGDTEEDTLDYSAIAANITADLGNGIGQHGSVTSAQSGTDKVFGFEDFIGGSGNDTIVASSVANVMDGGGGNDTFVFGSAGDADGDTIKGFQPGDKIDLSAIDANTGASGTQSFVLFAGNVFTSAGQVIVTHEIRDGLEHTIVAGNTNNDTVADFKVDIAGNHALTSADFNGVH